LASTTWHPGASAKRGVRAPDPRSSGPAGSPSLGEVQPAYSLRKVSTSAANSVWCWKRNPWAESG
jgi:hypothetical protein